MAIPLHPDSPAVPVATRCTTHSYVCPMDDSDARTFEVPGDPSLRRRVRRATVRVLVLDDRDRILLFQDSDPGAPGSAWWITPGGGIDDGETEVEAVVRELAEETGLAVDADRVHGPLARRRVAHGYSDQVVEQTDAFYLVNVAAFQVDTSGHTAEEQVTMLASRWWTRHEIATTGDEVWPAALTDLWELSGHPHRWPLVLPDVEESSVPTSCQG